MLQLTNVKIPKEKELKNITISEEGRIEKIEEAKSETTGNSLDIKGEIISLGGIDLQINGGLGLAFPDLEEKDIDKLDKIGQYLWDRGIDGYLPTLVTTSIEKFQTALKVIHTYIEKQEKKNRALILGVHLEGPFLNPDKKGAHPREHLLKPSIEAIEEICGEYLEIVKIITLAPELDMNGEVIEYLKERGVTVSLGHSTATAEQAKKAFDGGATMVTHAFNAMPPLHHRKPGLLGEAMLDDRVYCGLIADGKHVSPKMIEILLKVSDYHRGVFLVSDALAPIGLEEGLYPWDNRQIEIKQGTAKLLDGTLAGTTLPLLEGVKNLVRWGVCPVEEAILMATESPREAIGMGGLEVGEKANLLKWSRDGKTGELNWERLDIVGHLRL